MQSSLIKDLHVVDLLSSYPHGVHNHLISPELNTLETYQATLG